MASFDLTLRGWSSVRGTRFSLICCASYPKTNDIYLAQITVEVCPLNESNTRGSKMNRRDYLTLMGVAAGALATTSKFDLVSAQEQRAADPGTPTTSTVEDRARRMKWWHEAKFGMFIHWG